MEGLSKKKKRESTHRYKQQCGDCRSRGGGGVDGGGRRYRGWINGVGENRIKGKNSTKLNHC